MPFGGPTHERLAPVDDESPQTTSSGDVWAQIQHGTCNSSANATGFDRALTYSPPFFVRAHQTTKEDCTPGTLKASQVALVEPVAYLKDLVTSCEPCTALRPPLLCQHPPYRQAPQAPVPCNRCLAEALQRQCPHLRSIIGWGTRSAMRLPAFAGISNTGFEALTDQSPLELRKHREEAGEGASCWRREIEGLRQRDNSHAERRQFVQHHHEVDEGAPPPVRSEERRVGKEWECAG